MNSSYEDRLNGVVDYHNQTKHHFQQYARSPGYMDWANQPDPFRKFSGAPITYLSTIVKDESPPFHKLLSGVDNVEPLDVGSVSRFLDLSLSISAWKQAGESRWALRCNPSSGNLHPTEGYLVLPSLEGIHTAPGVHHYSPLIHTLERRTEFSLGLWNTLAKDFPEDSFFVGLTSIHWREAWKYGERAFRYCQHDIGHAWAALRIAAGALGWKLVLLGDVDDSSVASLLGIDRDEDFADVEREHPDLLAVVFPQNNEGKIPQFLSMDCIKDISSGNWLGQANRLSSQERVWNIIEKVSEDAIKPELLSSNARVNIVSRQSISIEPAPLQNKKMTSRQIIRQRRSAVSFDGVTHITSDQFYLLLSMLNVENESPLLPWDSVPWSPKIHLALFVHRVHGLKSGLYILVRDREKQGLLKDKMNPEFAWQKPENAPGGLGLFLLQERNFQSTATRVSCNQEIAGKSAFSLGMISEFIPALQETGAWFYRRLFWESGLVGQMLYLGAEYIGVRGTGIGCYFDDAMHDVLGMTDNTFQSLYHFTLGGPVDDSRLSTLPAYPWSCDLQAGRFPNRKGLMKDNASVAGTKLLKENSVLLHHAQSLSRIGFGPRPGSGTKPVPWKNWLELFDSPYNVFEFSPDKCDGQDEVLAGQALNRWQKEYRGDVKGCWFLSRAGYIGGNQGAMVDTLNSRDQGFKNIISLQDGMRYCIDPQFLRDQIERSRQRLGLDGIDAFLIRLPEDLAEHWSRMEALENIRTAFAFLQDQCGQGILRSFGLSLSQTSPNRLPWVHSVLSQVAQERKVFPGFELCEVPGIFSNPEVFNLEIEGTSIIRLIKENRLLCLATDPLIVNVEGNPIPLLEASNANTHKADVWKAVLNILEALKNSIHSHKLNDGRTLSEILKQSNIPSPFEFRQKLQGFLEQGFPQSERLSQMQDTLHASLSQIRFLFEQLMNAGLGQADWGQASIEAIDAGIEELIQAIEQMKLLQNQKVLNVVREQFFSKAPEGKALQTLALDYLYESGVDFVFTNMEHRSLLSTN